jgi:hypothetical protein
MPTHELRQLTDLRREQCHFIGLTPTGNWKTRGVEVAGAVKTTVVTGVPEVARVTGVTRVAEVVGVAGVPGVKINGELVVGLGGGT